MGNFTPYLPQSVEDGLKTLVKVPVDEGGEDLGQCGVFKRLNRNNVEVSYEPACHVVATPTRGTHCTH